MLKSTTYIVLQDYKFAPGSKFTKKQLKAAGQTDANIQQLLDSGVLTEDMDAELHPDHQPITVQVPKSISFEIDPIHVMGFDTGVGNG